MEDMNKLNERVTAYLLCRKRLDQAEEAYEAQTKPLRELKAMLEGWFSEFLTTTGQQTAVTPQGTVHWNTKTTASLEDPDAFMRHVIGTGQYELLERRANAKSAREFAEANGTLPPGVKLNTIRTIGVNKPGAKAQAAGKITAAVTGAGQ